MRCYNDSPKTLAASHDLRVCPHSFGTEAMRRGDATKDCCKTFNRTRKLQEQGYQVFASRACWISSNLSATCAEAMAGLDSNKELCNNRLTSKLS